MKWGRFVAEVGRGGGREGEPRGSRRALLLHVFEGLLGVSDCRACVLPFIVSLFLNIIVYPRGR